MLKVLLFSPKGAGNHYYGPGISAYRMYRHRDKNKLSVSLAHGYKEQKVMDVFDEHYYISDIENNNILSGARFLFNAKKWIKKNSHRFDVIHCLSAFHHSFMMAVWFERIGVPAVIKISESKHLGFNDSSFTSTLLGLRRYRQKHANEISAYISISSEIKKKLKDAGIQPEKIHDIPNGVDTQRFSPVNDT